MQIRRILRHLCHPRRALARSFPGSALQAIGQAITASEARHGCELRFVVEGALEGSPLFSGQSARERALDVFSLMRVWDTEANNGMLIYLLLADRKVEIVVDRGIAGKVERRFWEQLCTQIESAFALGEYQRGVLDAITATTQQLALRFPRPPGQANQLADAPVAQGRGAIPQPQSGSQRDFS